MKLTQNQTAALLEVRDDKVFKVNHGSCAWRIVAPTSSPVVIGRLKSMELIDWYKADSNTYAAELTERGQQALNANVDMSKEETNK